MTHVTAAGEDADGSRRLLGIPSPLIALEFLTVLRVRRAPLVDASALAGAQLWYPAVGALLGAALALLDLALRGRLAPAPESVLLLVAWEGMTGLLHLDGLADCADGLLGLHARARRLEILRDSRVGAFGVAAIVLYLLLANAALGALRGDARTAASLIAAPALGRAAIVGIAAILPYARADGLGLGFRRAARGWAGIGALLIALAIALLAGGAGGLLLLGAAAAGAACIAVLAWRRLGGVTGDVFGAGCELAQAGVLLAAVAMQGTSWFRPWL